MVKMKTREFSFFLILCWCVVFAFASLPTPEEMQRKWTAALSRKMTEFAERQIGSLQLQQMYENEVTYSRKLVDGQAELARLSDDVSYVLGNVSSVLKLDRDAVAKAYEANDLKSSRVKCCGKGTGNEVYNERFQTEVDLNELCDVLPNGMGLVDSNAKATMKNNQGVSSAVTWQYFGDYDGNYYQYPTNVKRFCDKDGNFEDHRFKKWYVNTASPKKKNVVIVIDESGSMRQPVNFIKLDSLPRMHYVKEAAKTVIDTLNPKDWAGVVAFSDDARSPKGCFGDKVAQANPSNKKILKDFVSDIKPRTRTKYAAGFEKAFDLLSAGKSESGDQFKDSIDIILFLTDGQPTDAVRENILEEVYKGQRKMRHSVHLLVYAFGREVFRDKKNIEFLHLLGDQNNGKLAVNGVTVPKWQISIPSFRQSRPVGPVGKVKSISDDNAKDLKTIMGSYYLSFPMATDTDTPSVTTPFLHEQQGLVITMGLPTMSDLGSGPEFTGVTAVDVLVEEIFKSVAYFKLGMHSYAFVVGRDGMVLVHPSFPKPSEHVKDPLFMSIDRLEPALSDTAVREIKDGKTGREKAKVNIPIARGKELFDGAVNVKLDASYYYKPVSGFESQYSIVLVLTDADRELRAPNVRSTTVKKKAPINYHRLDLKIQKNTSESSGICYSRQAGGLELPRRSTIKLAPQAFKKPDRYLERVETIEDVKALEEMIGEFSKTDNGLKTSVRSDVLLTSVMDQLWNRAKESVYRYVGTESGVFRVSPGMLADNKYNPTEQAWYQRAIGRPDIYTFSRPALSSFDGNTEVVGIGRVFSQKQTVQSSIKPVAGVTAADVGERYFQSLLYRAIPECSNSNIKCYMLDDSGYFMERAQRVGGEASHQHLTERLPWLASLLIGKGQYLKPTWCNKFNDQASQLFYDTSDFNFTSSGPGATECRQFQLSAVPETNVFLLVINDPASCHRGTVSANECKCSKECQMCDQFSDKKCQCPCACAFGFDNCANQFEKVLSDTLCPVPPKQSEVVQLKSPPDSVEECTQPCVARNNQSTCEKDGQCTWCAHNIYKDFPVCTNVCPTGLSTNVTIFFPCADLSLLSPVEREELVTSLRVKLVNLVPGLSQEMVEPQITAQDTVTVTILEEVRGPNLNVSVAIIDQKTRWGSKFLVGPNKAPAMFRAAKREEYTELYVEMTLPGVDFDAILANSLSARENVISQLKRIVVKHLPKEVAMSLGNVWLRQDIVPFTISKPIETPGSLLTSIQPIVNEVHSGKVKFSVNGRSVVVTNVMYSGMFHTICPSQCLPSLNETSCNKIPGCTFGNLDQPPTCGNNSFLPEKSEISVFLPCVHALDDLDQASQQELLSNFRHQVEALLPDVSQKALHSFKITQGSSFHGSRLIFIIQGTMMDPPVWESLQAFNGTFSWTRKATVGPNRDVDAYRTDDKIMPADEFTHLQIRLFMSPGVSLDTILQATPLEARSQIVGSVRSIVRNVMHPAVTETLSNVWIDKAYIPFIISKPVGGKLHLLSEFKKLKDKVDKKQVSIKVEGRELLVSTAQYIGGIDGRCPRTCEDGLSKAYCSTVPGCDWSDFESAGVCTDNALLAESTPVNVFFPCADFTELDPQQRSQLLQSLSLKIHALLPNISRKALHSWSFVEDTKNQLSFTLQGAMKDPPLSASSTRLAAMLDWNNVFTVGTATYPDKYRSRQKLDFTDMKFNLLYKGVDFDKVLMEAANVAKRQQIEASLMAKLKTVLPHNVFATVGNIIIQKDTLSFSIHKDIDDTYRLLDLLDLLHKAVLNRQLDVAAGDTFTATALDYHGSFQQHCPMPCEQGLNQTTCSQIIGCSWDRLSAPPHCSNNSLLQERSNHQMFFPCLDVNVLLGAEKQEIQDIFKANLLGRLPDVTEKNVHSVELLPGGTISFVVQPSVLSSSLSEINKAVNSAISDIPFNVGPNSSPSKYTSRDGKDFTNVRIQLNFDGVDLIETSRRRPLTARNNLEHQLKKLGHETFTSAVSQTVTNVWIGKDNIPFTIKKEPNSPVNLMEEAAKLANKLKSGKVQFSIEGVSRAPSSIEISGTFYELCPTLCSSSSEEVSCHLSVGCDWCVFDGEPHCGQNCTLPERLHASAFFPCMEHLPSGEESEILDTFHQKVSLALSVSPATISNLARNGSVITFDLQTSMNGKSLQDLSRALQHLVSSSQLSIGPRFDPSRYVARQSSDFTSVKVTSLFSDRDFNKELATSLDVRLNLDHKLKQLVAAKLNTGLTYGNLWIVENRVSYVISKRPDSKVDLLHEVAKLWADPSDYLGATSSVIEGGFRDLCPSRCTQRTTAPSCEREHDCQWCLLDKVPYCGNDCLLQERVSNITLVLPCLTSDLSPQVVDQIEHSVAVDLAGLADLDVKAVDNITLVKNTISVEIVGVLGQKPLSESWLKLIGHLKKRVFTIGPDNNPTQFKVRVEGDYTEATLTLKYDDSLDLEKLVSSDVGLRERVSKKLQEMVSTYFPRDIAETISDIQLGKTTVSFVIQHPSDIPGSILSDVESFINDHQMVLLPLTQPPMPPVDWSYDLGYGVDCGFNCSVGSNKDTCQSLKGCYWCDLDKVPSCDNDCFLPETLTMTAFIPCNETLELSELQRNETLEYFHKKLMTELIGRISVRSLVRVELTPDGVEFDIQATVKMPVNAGTKDLIHKMFSSKSKFTIGPRDRRDLLEVRNVDDYTDLTLAMALDYDFTNMVTKDVTSRRDLLTHLKSSLGGVLSSHLLSGITLDNVAKNVIVFTLTKPSNDTVYLLDKYTQIEQYVKSGQLKMTLLSSTTVKGLSVAVIKGHYYSLCPTSAPLTTTIVVSTTSDPTTPVPPVVIVKGKTVETVKPVTSTTTTLPTLPVFTQTTATERVTTDASHATVSTTERITTSVATVTTDPVPVSFTADLKTMCKSFQASVEPVTRTTTLIVYNASDLTNASLRNLTSQSNVSVCAVTMETCSLCGQVPQSSCEPVTRNPAVLSKDKNKIRPVNPGNPESLSGGPDDKTGLSNSEKIGIGIAVPLGILAALSALGLLFFLCRKKKPKKTSLRPRSVAPIEPFNPNIYQASIGDDLSHEFAAKGAELDRFKDPNAVYGRLANSPTFDRARPGSGHSTSSTLSWESNRSYGRPLVTGHK